MIPVHSLHRYTLVSVEHCYPAVQVDQTESRADLGFKSPRRFQADVGAAARADALDGVARRVRDGEQLGHIERRDASVGALARATFQVSWPQVSVAALPAHGPQIEVIPGEWRWEVVPSIGAWLDVQV